jgi:cellulose synthase/poly-beta-1,6-N-acetylglucosamine synthase-like glycosyltransferase
VVSTWVTYPLLTVYLTALVLLFLYGVNCHLLILYHRRGRRRYVPPAPLGPADPHPRVTVQLPIYNERYVARRAIEAAGRLRYPADRLQIQVLDDSTDPW